MGMGSHGSCRLGYWGEERHQSWSGGRTSEWKRTWAFTMDSLGRNRWGRVRVDWFDQFQQFSEWELSLAVWCNGGKWIVVQSTGRSSVKELGYGLLICLICTWKIYLQTICLPSLWISQSSKLSKYQKMKAWWIQTLTQDQESWVGDEVSSNRQMYRLW